MSKGAIRKSDISELQTKLTLYLSKLKKKSKLVNRQVAEQILQESSVEVPKMTFALSVSQFIEELDDKKGTVKFGYGGPNVIVNPKTGESTDEYMLRVHEDLSIKHVTGKAKFLEDPFIRNLSRVTAKQAKELGRVRV